LLARYFLIVSTWNEEAKLLASDGAEDDEFGDCVSIDGDYAIIGVHYDDDNGDNSGSAYVFKRDGQTWTEKIKLLPSDGADSDKFGCSVSIEGDYVIIGAWSDDDNGVDSGSAYIFRKLLPNLVCVGTLEFVDVEPGATVTGTITVENIGEVDSLLDWEIQSYPDWGSWSFDPDSGNDLLAGDSVIIDVEVVAPDETEETFTGEVILVNSEDPTDICTIDVSLATPVNQFQSNQQIPSFLQSIIERYLILQQVLGL